MKQAPDDAVACRIYRGRRRAETYLFVTRERDLEPVPDALLEALGQLEPVMELELHPGRGLARADPRAVLRSLAEQGYYLQLPPVDTPGGGPVH